MRAPGDVADINLRVRAQVQGVVETKPPDASDERPAAETSFFVRRLRLLLQGHVLRREARYYVQLGMAEPDMEPDLRIPVRDAWMQWQRLRDVQIRVGQGKVPFTRERNISSSALAMVDRSNVNAALNLDRDVGITALSHDLFGAGDRLRYAVGVFGGDGRNRRANRAGLLWVARFEVLPLGRFEDLSGTELPPPRTPKIALGTAFAYNDDTVRTASTLGSTLATGSIDYRHASADLLVRWRGATLLSEAVYRSGSANRESAPSSPAVRSGWGIMVQAGVLVLPRVELLARLGEVRSLDAERQLEREVGGGVSWYVSGHDVKLQADYFRLQRDGANAMPDTDRVRVQTQLFF